MAASAVIPAPASAQLITVVIPVWGDYLSNLPQVIRAYREQSIREFIVITQGQTITSQDLGLGEEQLQVVMVAPGSSIGATRNRTLPLLRTPLVCFADADDLPLPGAMNWLSSILLTNPQLLLAAGSSLLPSGEPYPWPPRWAYLAWPPKLRLFWQWSQDHILMVTGTVIRTQAAQVAGGFADGSLAEDAAFADVLLALGEVYLSRVPTRLYRPHPLGLCQRGASRAEWSQAQKRRRQHIRQNRSLPSLLRIAVTLLAPFHFWNSYRLAKQVRFDRY